MNPRHVWNRDPGSSIPTGRTRFWAPIPGVKNAGLLSAVPPGPRMSSDVRHAQLTSTAVERSAYRFVPEGQIESGPPVHWRVRSSSPHRAPEGRLSHRTMRTTCDPDADGSVPQVQAPFSAPHPALKRRATITGPSGTSYVLRRPAATQLASTAGCPTLAFFARVGTPPTDPVWDFLFRHLAVYAHGRKAKAPRRLGASSVLNAVRHFYCRLPSPIHRTPCQSLISTGRYLRNSIPLPSGRQAS